jgi:DNA replication ATP-dependent helicase Dna2
LPNEGEEVGQGLAVQFEEHDPEKGIVLIRVDRFANQGGMELPREGVWRLERRAMEMEGLLLEGLETVFREENEEVVRTLLGKAGEEVHQGRMAEGKSWGKAQGFTEAQTEALAHAVGTESVCLIQGPPGTGKTRVLAEAALLLARKRCRVFVCGFTHRAIENLLLAIRALDPLLPLFKVGRVSSEVEAKTAKIQVLRKLENWSPPPGGFVVGGTAFVARKPRAKRMFHYVFLDEAGQLPVVHAALAMTLARRYVIAGDPCQLPPVRAGVFQDPELGSSIFEHLARFHPFHFLNLSFRMNEGLCTFVSEEFYDGKLLSAQSAAQRRLNLVKTEDDEKDPIAALLDEGQPLIWAKVLHRGRLRSSPEEAKVVGDLCEELMLRQGMSPKDLVVLSPYRSQVREIMSALGGRGLLRPGLCVDTIERMQGQEREVVLISAGASDRDDLERQGAFYYDPGRWNVALSRARTKCVLVASPELFRARPMDLEALVAVAHLKRLGRELPWVEVH